MVRIADHADVAVRRAELTRERILRRVRVLELVHEHVQVLPRAPFQRLLRLAEEARRLRQQVVEIECGGGAQPLPVADEGACDDLREVALGVSLEVLGAAQFALHPGDGGEHGARREAARIHVQIVEHAAHERRLVGIVVDDVVGRKPDSLAVYTQPARAHRVEGAEVQLRRVLAEAEHARARASRGPPCS